MATRKEKHAAAVAKREAYMKQVEADGLAALEADRKRRKENELLAQTKALKNAKLARQVASTSEAFQKIGKTLENLTVGEYLDAANKTLPVLSS